MNDEIKQIIEDIKLTLDVTVKDMVLLNRKDINQLLDYITNLQQENDILKRNIEVMKHNYNLLVRCIENGESMTQKFENGLTYQDYKSRNEKAIDYIKILLSVTTYNKPLYNLLDILQGVDKE